MNIYGQEIEKFLDQTKKETPYERNFKDFWEAMRRLDFVTGVAMAVEEKHSAFLRQAVEDGVLRINDAALPEGQTINIRLGQANVVTADSGEELRMGLNIVNQFADKGVSRFADADHPLALFLDSVRDKEGTSFFQAVLERLDRVFENMRKKSGRIVIVDGLYGSNRFLMDILNTMLVLYAKELGCTLIIGSYETGWAERLQKAGIPLNFQHMTVSDRQSSEPKDNAQLSVSDDHAMKPSPEGGIDFNPAQMSMQVKGRGEDFKFDWNGQTFDAAQITGVTFKIETMTTVTDLSLALGLKN